MKNYNQAIYYYEKALKDHDPEFSDLLKKKSPSSSTLKAAIARLISIWQEDRSSVRTSQEEANADLRQISDAADVALQATKEFHSRWRHMPAAEIQAIYRQVGRDEALIKEVPSVVAGCPIGRTWP